MAPQYEVPQEIIDAIIVLCAENTFALKHLSVVAKSWIVPSRRHLFSSLTLGGARRVFRFRHQEPISQRQESTFEQLSELDAFLESTPEIGSECISSLRLRFESSANSPTYFDPPTNAVLCQILGKLKHVRVYSLHLGSWGAYNLKDPNSQVEAAIISLLHQPETESILISNSELPSSKDLVDLIAHSPSLNQLSILDPLLRDEHSVPAISSQFTTHLSYLRLDSILYPMVPALLSPTFPIKVNKLKQARLRLAVRPEACELIKQLLEEASATLQELEFADHPLFQDSPQFFPINSLTNLRILRFTGFRAHGFHSSVRWIAHIFSEMSAPLPLEEVHIATLTHRLMIPSQFENGSTNPALFRGDRSVGELMLWGPLQEIDESLASKYFPCIRKLDVTITIRDPYESSPAEFFERTRNSFPKLSALSKKIVKVTVSTSVY